MLLTDANGDGHVIWGVRSCAGSDSKDTFVLEIDDETDEDLMSVLIEQELPQVLSPVACRLSLVAEWWCRVLTHSRCERRGSTCATQTACLVTLCRARMST